jgi:hypothetical protein
LAVVNSTHEVLPPKWFVPGPGVAIDPLVPQKRTLMSLAGTFCHFYVTTSWLTTLVTPSVLRAISAARAFAALDRTVPFKVTT